MKKVLSVLFFLILVCSIFVFSEEVEIDSTIIDVDAEFEFFIIEVGEEDGIEIGDGLIVHRDGDKIARAYIIEVRPNVSAAEILDVEEDIVIQKGDSIFLVKKIGKPPAPPQPRQQPRRIAKRSEWTPLLGAPSRPSITTTSPKRELTSAPEPAYTARPAIVEQGEVISIEVYKDPEAVFVYSSLVLKENGFLISSSNRAKGILSATRPITLSLVKELWADAFAAIGHNLVVSLEIKGEGDSSRLVLSSFKEHSQKGKQIKRAVMKNSKYYSELVNLVYDIKERSEY